MRVEAHARFEVGIAAVRLDGRLHNPLREKPARGQAQFRVRSAVEQRFARIWNEGEPRACQVVALSASSCASTLRWSANGSARIPAAAAFVSACRALNADPGL